MFSLQNIYADSTSECQNSSSFPPLSLLFSFFLKKLPSDCSLYMWWAVIWLGSIWFFLFSFSPLHRFILCHALYSYHSFGNWLDSIISSFVACLDLLQLLSVNTNKIGRGELFVSFWAGVLSLFLWCTMFLSVCVCVLHYIHKYLF